MLISVVGKSGSGKSTVTRELAKRLDGVSIDIDKIAHQVNSYPQVIEEIKYSFGQEYVQKGIINRKLLGNLVFLEKIEMNKLKTITWKYMKQEIDTIISSHPNKVIILDYIRLPETEYFEQSDLTVLVDTPFEDRMKRVVKRDNITKEAFRIRENGAPNYDNISFDIILKNASTEQTRKDVAKIYEKSIVRREL